MTVIITDHNLTYLFSDNALHLLRLPVEIRNRIYHYASFEENGNIFTPFPRIPSGLQDEPPTTADRFARFNEAHYSVLHSLLRVSLQIHDEVLNYMHKHIPVTVGLNTPAMNDEFGTRYKWEGNFDSFEFSDLVSAEEEEYPDNPLPQSNSEGPIQQELKKWRRLEVHTYYDKDCKEFVGRIRLAGTLQSFLESLKHWSIPTGTTLAIYMQSVYIFGNKYFSDYQSHLLGIFHIWLKQMRRVQSWDLKLLVSKQLVYEARLGSVFLYQELGRFLETHKYLVVDEEIWYRTCFESRPRTLLTNLSG